MGLLFSFIGLIMMLAMCVGVIILVIFLARKVGLLKLSEGEGAEEGQSRIRSLGSYLNDIKRFSHSIVFRFAIVALLIAVMTVPLDMVGSIVKERSGLYHNVQTEVAETWGHLQKLRGPALLIPYTEKYDSVEILTDKDGNERKKNKTVYQQRTAIVLPDKLNIDVSLLGQTRKRSIYESLVYTADLSISGNFVRPDILQLSNHINEIHWDRAWFSLGVSDTQAINKVSALQWTTNSNGIDFEPGTKITKTVASGFHAPIDLTKVLTDKPIEAERYPFSLELNMNGSQGFFFSPFGKTTNVTIDSDWPHPSFQGNVLPDSYDDTPEGFTANWSIPHLARNYPQLWTLETQSFDVDEFNAGVNLFEPVSLYSQITRAIKYGVLFLVLTYITFLLFEMGISRRLHIVQYGVIGLALSIFYLTLLSMAEHAGFFKAYLTAAAIIISMISLYVLSAIRSLARTSIIALLLIGLYGLLYTMLRLEDYALLAGSGMLLIVLAVMMYLTRNIGKANLIDEIA